VFIVQATIEALGLDTDDFPVNKSIIQRVRTKLRQERAVFIKRDFQNEIPKVRIVTVHWDGKMLPEINVKNSKEERLPILVSFGMKEQLLAVPKLESSMAKIRLMRSSTQLQTGI
jgi:hypothetical protein